MTAKRVLTAIALVIFAQCAGPGAANAAPAATAGPADGLNVNVVNTPLPVTLDPAAVVPVQPVSGPPLQPFQGSGGQSVINGISQSELLTVPAGKTAVVESVSFNGSLPVGESYLFLLLQVLQGSSFVFEQPIPTTLQVANFPNGAGGFENRFTTNQLIRLYAGPGTTIRMTVQSTSSAAGNHGFTQTTSTVITSTLPNLAGEPGSRLRVLHS